MRAPSAAAPSTRARFVVARFGVARFAAARLAVAVIAAAWLGAGCSSPNARSCTVEPEGEQATCLEYQRASDDAIEHEARPACAARGGRWSSSPCSRSNALAGCMQRQVTQRYGAYTLVTWYYVASEGLRTPPDVVASCRGRDGVTLSP